MNLKIGSEPKLPTKKEWEHRQKLINDELLEWNDSIQNRETRNSAKELADVLYTVYGAAVEQGIDIDTVFRIVHASNMGKLGDDGKPTYREDGKIMKGPNYKPPDLNWIKK